MLILLVSLVPAVVVVVGGVVGVVVPKARTRFTPADRPPVACE